MYISHLPSTPSMGKFSQRIKTNCPTCDRPVYAAEQVLGPGSIPYHKSCLKCKQCLKTLSAGNVSEHGYDAYCKICHSRQFGIKGVGYGNLLSLHSTTTPDVSESASPKLSTGTSASSPCTSAKSEVPWSSSSKTNNHGSNTLSCFDEQHQTTSKTLSANMTEEKMHESSPSFEYRDDGDFQLPSLNMLRITVKPKDKTSSGSIAQSAFQAVPNDSSRPELGQVNHSIDSPDSNGSKIRTIPTHPPRIPPKPVSLGPRASSSSPFGLNPQTNPPADRPPFRTDGPQKCPLCLQTVYHAEQVLAIGKKWHKRCLRCWECKRVLDSNLNERLGKPYCIKCYDAQFGTGSHGFVLRAGFAGK